MYSLNLHFSFQNLLLPFFLFKLSFPFFVFSDFFKAFFFFLSLERIFKLEELVVGVAQETRLDERFRVSVKGEFNVDSGFASVKVDIGNVLHVVK